jgi:hypothetical protein
MGQSFGVGPFLYAWRHARLLRKDLTAEDAEIAEVLMYFLCGSPRTLRFFLFFSHKVNAYGAWHAFYYANVREY